MEIGLLPSVLRRQAANTVKTVQVPRAGRFGRHRARHEGVLRRRRVQVGGDAQVGLGRHLPLAPTASPDLGLRIREKGLRSLGRAEPNSKALFSFSFFAQRPAEIQFHMLLGG